MPAMTDCTSSATAGVGALEQNCSCPANTRGSTRDRPLSRTACDPAKSEPFCDTTGGGGDVPVRRHRLRPARKGATTGPEPRQVA